MAAGLRYKIPYEVACGGNAECCTCHVYVPLILKQQDDWQPPAENEQDALDWAESTTEQSRLACQLKVTESMDGHTIIFIGS